LGQKLYIRREKSKIQDVEVNFIIQTVITVCMSFKVLKMRCLGRGKGLLEEIYKRKDLRKTIGIYTS